MKKPQAGFTIVELLIVIVVIAILATISIVAYNGIQVRARNTARLTAAQNIYKQLEMYTRQTGQGFGSNVFCLPTGANFDAGNGGLPDCYASNAPRSEDAVANSNFTAQKIQFSYPNTSITAANDVQYYGIQVAFFLDLTQGMSGVLRPYVLSFWLEGNNQDCGSNSVSRDNSKVPSIL